MKFFSLTLIVLFVSLAAHASSNGSSSASASLSSMVLITNPDARALGCPALAIGTITMRSSTSIEIASASISLESGDEGEATGFRHVSHCLSAAPCDAYDVAPLTTSGYGEKMTLMFLHNSDRDGKLIAGFGQLTVLSGDKVCSYKLTETNAD